MWLHRFLPAYHYVSPVFSAFAQQLFVSFAIFTHDEKLRREEDAGLSDCRSCLKCPLLLPINIMPFTFHHDNAGD